MGTMAFQITSLSIVCSTVYSGADQRKLQSSAPLAFVRGIHRSPVNSPHKWPVTWNCFHLMTSSWKNSLPICGEPSTATILVEVKYGIFPLSSSQYVLILRRSHLQHLQTSYIDYRKFQSDIIIVTKQIICIPYLFTLIHVLHVCRPTQELMIII